MDSNSNAELDYSDSELAYHVAGSMLNAFHASSHLILTKTYESRKRYFPDEDK